MAVLLSRLIGPLPYRAANRPENRKSDMKKNQGTVGVWVLGTCATGTLYKHGGHQPSRKSQSDELKIEGGEFRLPREGKYVLNRTFMRACLWRSNLRRG